LESFHYLWKYLQNSNQIHYSFAFSSWRLESKWSYTLSGIYEIRKTKLEVSEFDEKQFLSEELNSIVKQDFGVEVSVFAEDDANIYDPKGKARHARPFKPAILIE